MEEKMYSTQKEIPEKSGTNKLKEFLGLILYCAVILVIMFFVIKYVGQRTVVVGDSMETTLHDGDNLITDKLTYHFSDPKRYDIVVFPFKDNTSQLLIKRIIGMPGETVQIIDGKVYINDVELDENYGNEVMRSAGLAGEPITLGEDEYFVLGDNRNNSQDSRFESVGNIHRSDLVGRAWVRIWPLDTISLLKHQ